MRHRQVSLIFIFLSAAAVSLIDSLPKGRILEWRRPAGEGRRHRPIRAWLSRLGSACTSGTSNLDGSRFSSRRLEEIISPALSHLSVSKGLCLVKCVSAPNRNGVAALAVSTMFVWKDMIRPVLIKNSDSQCANLSSTNNKGEP